MIMWWFTLKFCHNAIKISLHIFILKLAERKHDLLWFQKHDSSITTFDARLRRYYEIKFNIALTIETISTQTVLSLFFGCSDIMLLCISSGINIDSNELMKMHTRAYKTRISKLKHKISNLGYLRQQLNNSILIVRNWRKAWAKELSSFRLLKCR